MNDAGRAALQTEEGQGSAEVAFSPKNPALMSYFSPQLVMRCILVCMAEIQRALHVHGIPESPPL